MAIDFTRYNPPGIYTEAVKGPQLAVRSSVPTAVAVFGLSVGYKTFRESLKINPDTGDLTTIQQISINGNPDTGTFTLAMGGAPSVGIAPGATPSTVQAAIEGLAEVVAGAVAVTGADGGPYTAEFDPRPGGYVLMTANATGLGGGLNPTVGITKEDHGTPAINQAFTQRGIKTTVGTEPDIDPATGKLLDTLVVKDPNTGELHVEGRDYVVVRYPIGGAGEDTTAGTDDDLYTISRVVDGHIHSGDIVQVQYQYTDPDYHKVYTFYDYDDIRDMYGEPFDAAGNIQSELTLCCKFAFTNGASTCLTCAVDPSIPGGENMADYADALDKFRDEPQIAIIVPANGAQPLQALVKQHVEAQSNNRYERRAIIGMDGSARPIPTATRIDNAMRIADTNRIALVSPSRFFYYAPELNRQIILGGQYMAAALAGLSVSMIAAMPLTHKNPEGFVEPAEFQREGEKSNESNNGLMVIERTRRNLIQVRHGVTVNPTDLLTREWSIIGQQDVMVYRIRDYLDADGLIGMPIYDTTLIQVKASAESALVSLVRDEVIRNYQNLKVRQLATLPDVLEVRYEWLPAYPLNYIVVRYSVAVLTGDITVTETTI